MAIISSFLNRIVVKGLERGDPDKQSHFYVKKNE